MSWTQKLTQTLARTLHFTATGCCPRCRLVQTIGKRCKAGCHVRPKRITAGDEEFFEPLRAQLKVVPEDPQHLREHRVALGLITYVVAIIVIMIAMSPIRDPDKILIGILSAAVLPIAIAMVPQLKRSPPRVSNTLSTVPALRHLPPRTDDVIEGDVQTMTEEVRSYLGGDKCVVCALVGVARGGDVAIRSRRGGSFQVHTEGGVVVVKGPLELVGPFSRTAATIDAREIKQLGIKGVDIEAIEWREHIVARGARVRVYGTPEKKQVPEVSPYREQLVDLIESPAGTVVELLV